MIESELRWPASNWRFVKGSLQKAQMTSTRPILWPSAFRVATPASRAAARAWCVLGAKSNYNGSDWRHGNARPGTLRRLP